MPDGTGQINSEIHVKTAVNPKNPPQLTQPEQTKDREELFSETPQEKILRTSKSSLIDKIDIPIASTSETTNNFIIKTVPTFKEITGEEKEKLLRAQKEKALPGIRNMLERSKTFLYQVNLSPEEKRTIQFSWTSGISPEVKSYLEESEENSRQINNVLAESFLTAFSSYHYDSAKVNWQYFINQADNFSVGYVGSGEIERLIKDLQSKDPKIIEIRKAHLSASFAHEFIHHEIITLDESLEGDETGPQIAQLLLNPKENVIFNELVIKMLSEHKNEDIKDVAGYPGAMYRGIIRIISRLKDKIPDLKGQIEKEGNNPSLGTLKKVVTTYLPSLKSEELHDLRREVLDEYLKPIKTK